MEDLFSLLNVRLGLLFKNEINKKFWVFLLYSSLFPHTWSSRGQTCRPVMESITWGCIQAKKGFNPARLSIRGFGTLLKGTLEEVLAPLLLPNTPLPFSSHSPACWAVILCTCRLCISSRFHTAASYFRISNRRACHHCEPNTSEESVVSAPLRGRSSWFSGGRVATFLISNRCRKADVWEPSVLLEGIYPHRQRKTQTQACSVIDTSRWSIHASQALVVCWVIIWPFLCFETRQSWILTLVGSTSFTFDRQASQVHVYCENNITFFSRRINSTLR